jgi:hypothetical protein
MDSLKKNVNYKVSMEKNIKKKAKKYDAIYLRVDGSERFPNRGVEPRATAGSDQ